MDSLKTPSSYRTSLEYTSEENFKKCQQNLKDCDTKTQSMQNDLHAFKEGNTQLKNTFSGMRTNKINNDSLKEQSNLLNSNIKLYTEQIKDLKTDNKDFRELKEKLESKLKYLETQKLNPEDISKVSNAKSDKEKELLTVQQENLDLRNKLQELERLKQQALSENSNLESLRKKRQKEIDMLNKEKSILLSSPPKSDQNSRAQSPIRKAKKDDAVDNMVIKFMRENNLRVKFD